MGKIANVADFNKCGESGYMERLPSPRKKGLTEASPFDDYSYSQTLAQRMSRSRSSGLPLRDWLAATIGIHC